MAVKGFCSAEKLRVQFVVLGPRVKIIILHISYLNQNVASWNFP